MLMFLKDHLGLLFQQAMKKEVFVVFLLAVLAWNGKTATALSSRDFFEILSQEDLARDKNHYQRDLPYESQDDDYDDDEGNMYKRVIHDLPQRDYVVFKRMHVFYEMSIDYFVKKRCPVCGVCKKASKSLRQWAKANKVKQPNVIYQRMYVRGRCKKPKVIIKECNVATSMPPAPPITRPATQMLVTRGVGQTTVEIGRGLVTEAEVKTAPATQGPLPATTGQVATAPATQGPLPATTGQVGTAPATKGPAPATTEQVGTAPATQEPAPATTGQVATAPATKGPVPATTGQVATAPATQKPAPATTGQVGTAPATQGPAPATTEQVGTAPATQGPAPATTGQAATAPATQGPAPATTGQVGTAPATQGPAPATTEQVGTAPATQGPVPATTGQIGTAPATQGPAPATAPATQGPAPVTTGQVGTAPATQGPAPATTGQVGTAPATKGPAPATTEQVATAPATKAPVPATTGQVGTAPATQGPAPATTGQVGTAPVTKRPLPAAPVTERPIVTEEIRTRPYKTRPPGGQLVTTESPTGVVPATKYPLIPRPLVPNRGCPAFCRITTAQKTQNACKAWRRKDLALQRVFYKLRKSTEYRIAVLNQTSTDITMHFMLDGFAAHHYNLYYSALRKTIDERLMPKALKLFGKQNFTTFEQYFQVASFFKKGLRLDRSDLTVSKYFKVPSTSYKYFTDISIKKRFLKDRYFVEERLAGVNPMSIRRVTFRGKVGTSWRSLRRRLNPKFRWANAVTRITRKSLTKSIRYRQVYVVEYPLLKNLPSMGDFLAGITKSKAKMMKQSIPIAIFASRYNRRLQKYELKIVAIQIGSHKGASVYTPSRGLKWKIAKGLLQSVDIFFSQVYNNELQTRLRMQPLCVILNRHLSELHPLHEILKYHCRGMLTVDIKRLGRFLDPKKEIRSLYSFGSQGAGELIKRGYKKMVWNDIGVRNNVKDRGMDDKRKVPFYPYRDDGKVLDSALKNFSRQFVSLYYKRNRDVARDFELQKFINELSVNGDVPPLDGSGGVKGLPGKFRTRRQLIDFISQTLWIVVQHAVVNFPNAEYGQYAAVYPTKLYNDVRAVNWNKVAYTLPGAMTACIQAGFSYTLGTFHYDTLFDYSEYVRDSKLRKLVAETYQYFMCDIKKIMDKRNARRFKQGHLTNPFMVPGWMPNSIST